MAWDGPERLGGTILAPSAVSLAPNRLDIFGGSEESSQLVHWWWNNGWGGPELLGGNALGSVSAVSWGPSRLDIFSIEAVDASGGEGQLSHWWFDNGWGQPELLGGNLGLIGPPWISGVSAVSWASGRLDVFGTDLNTNLLVHWWFDNGWGGPESPVVG